MVVVVVVVGGGCVGCGGGGGSSGGGSVGGVIFPFISDKLKYILCITRKILCVVKDTI